MILGELLSGFREVVVVVVVFVFVGHPCHSENIPTCSSRESNPDKHSTTSL